MIFSVSAEPNKRLRGDSLLWGLLQYWFFIKVLSSKMKFSMIIQTCSWKHYEISFAWQYLLQQIFMHTLENSPVIILNQTIDLRVKKKWYPCQRAVQIIENFLFCFSLSIDSFLSNRKERKLQLQQCCSCCYTYRSNRFSSINPYCHRFLNSAVVWHLRAQLFFNIWILIRIIYLKHFGPYSVLNHSAINLDLYLSTRAQSFCSTFCHLLEIILFKNNAWNPLF